MNSAKIPQKTPDKKSVKVPRITFYDRVRTLADTTLRYSRDTEERAAALEVLRLMEQKTAA